LGIGLVYGLSFTMMCLKVKEGDYPPPAQPKEGAGKFFVAARTYFHECFSKPYYIWVFASIALPWIAFIGVNHFSVYFAKSLAMDMGFYGKCLALTYGCSLVLSYPLGMLADKFHPLRTSLVTILLYALVTAAGAIFSTKAEIFAVFFVLHGVLSGAWFTSSASLPLRMFPKENFSQFYAALNMFIGLGIMTAGPIVGHLIDFTQKFYRLTFIASSSLAFLAVLLGLIVHAKFMKLGGPKGYTPPAYFLSQGSSPSAVGDSSRVRKPDDREPISDDSGIGLLQSYKTAPSSRELGKVGSDNSRRASGDFSELRTRTNSSTSDDSLSTILKKILINPPHEITALWNHLIAMFGSLD
jgi:hypothetical protein